MSVDYPLVVEIKERKETRSEMAFYRVTPTEKARIQTAAKRERKKLSQYSRSAVLAKVDSSAAR